MSLRSLTSSRSGSRAWSQGHDAPGDGQTEREKLSPTYLTFQSIGHSVLPFRVLLTYGRFAEWTFGKTPRTLRIK